MNDEERKYMRRTRALIVAVLMTLAAVTRALPHAQTDQTFEVVSIKQNKGTQLGARWRVLPGGTFEMTNAPISVVVLMAYQVQDVFQVSGLPEWTRSERFDIEAKSPLPLPPSVYASNSPLPEMLRGMLVERLKLVAHTEKRTMPVYSLVTARNDGKLGPQLMPSIIDCTTPNPTQEFEAAGGRNVCGVQAAIGYYAVRGVPLKRLTDYLASSLGRPVLDRTGLQGNFDFELRFNLEPPAGAAGAVPQPPSADPNVPSLTTAVQEQLGLKVVSTSAPVDVVVIEQIEHPTPD